MIERLLFLNNIALELLYLLFRIQEKRVFKFFIQQKTTKKLLIVEK
jgi:hypothetical protein